MTRRDFLNRMFCGIVGECNSNSFYGYVNKFDRLKAVAYPQIELYFGQHIYTTTYTDSDAHYYNMGTQVWSYYNRYNNSSGSTKGFDSRYELSQTANNVTYGYCPPVFVIRDMDKDRIVFCNCSMSSDTGLITTTPSVIYTNTDKNYSLYLPTGNYSMEMILSGAGFDFDVTRIRTYSNDFANSLYATLVSDEDNNTFAVPNALQNDYVLSSSSFPYSPFITIYAQIQNSYYHSLTIILSSSSGELYLTVYEGRWTYDSETLTIDYGTKVGEYKLSGNGTETIIDYSGTDYDNICVVTNGMTVTAYIQALCNAYGAADISMEEGASFTLAQFPRETAVLYGNISDIPIV